MKLKENLLNPKIFEAKVRKNFSCSVSLRNKFIKEIVA